MDKRLVTPGDAAFTSFLPWLCVLAANCGDNLVAWAGLDPLDWNFHAYATSLTSAGLVAGLILSLAPFYGRAFATGTVVSSIGSITHFSVLGRIEI